MATASVAMLGAIAFHSNAAPPPGQLLAAQCFQCHGTNGQAVGGFESISGKKANEMFNELREMGQRRAETIMDLQVRAYTPEQLRLIANYLATLPKGSNRED
ncbi:MAG: cytochrome C [Verrucomicrobiae bacterium]|nr:cytochrome C [Verrucomicrobiae bacterium]